MDDFTWIVIATFAIVTFIFKFFYKRWEDRKPDMLYNTLLQNFCKKIKTSESIDESKTALHLLIAEAGRLLLSPITPRPCREDTCHVFGAFHWHHPKTLIRIIFIFNCHRQVMSPYKVSLPFHCYVVHLPLRLNLAAG